MLLRASCGKILFSGNMLLHVFLFQLMVLDAVPDLDLLAHLPEFLDGLFNIFKDRNAEIRKMLVIVSVH